MSVKKRLEYLRGELRAERISYDELHELQSLAQHIEPGDVELLEAAGVPESAGASADTLFDMGKDGKKRVNAPKVKQVIREAWLLSAAEKMLPWLKAAGAGATPKYRLSVGWPLGGRPKSTKGAKRIGECFCSSCSKDGTHEIFISPVLDDAETVLHVLLHELIHAFVGIKAKHGKDFKVVAVKAGLTGKMTATVPSEDLKPKLLALAKELGGYPHASLGTGGDRLKPKQGTRMLKVECPKCEYTVRTTQKWIDVGLPICPCGATMATDGGDEDSDDDE